MFAGNAGCAICSESRLSVIHDCEIDRASEQRAVYCPHDRPGKIYGESEARSLQDKDTRIVGIVIKNTHLPVVRIRVSEHNSSYGPG